MGVRTGKAKTNEKKPTGQNEESSRVVECYRKKGQHKHSEKHPKNNSLLVKTTQMLAKMDVESITLACAAPELHAIGPDRSQYLVVEKQAQVTPKLKKDVGFLNTTSMEVFIKSVFQWKNTQQLQIMWTPQLQVSYDFIMHKLRVTFGQKGTLICSASNRLYSQEMRIIKNIDTAYLRRGTGGRSSFSGNVVTVFGATGFLGPYIINQLGKRGTQLIIAYRGDSDDSNLKKLKLAGDLGQVLFQPFDLRDSLSIRKAVRYSNIVINLIGRDFETRNFNFYKVHVKAAEEIAKACKEFNVERLIHFSDLNVTDNPEKYYLKKLQYLPTKLLGEKVVLNEFPKATIFRPTSIYGFHDRFLWPLCVRDRSKNLSIPLYAKGEKTIKQPVYAADVAEGVINAINDYDSRGKIYQAVGPEKFYLKDLALFCSEVLHRHKLVNKLIHDIKYDISFPFKVVLNRYILGFFFHEPNRNLSFEHIERESVSDKVNSCLPTLLDLGVSLSKFEDKVPRLILKHFMTLPGFKNVSDYEYSKSISEKAVKDYSF